MQWSAPSSSGRVVHSIAKLELPRAAPLEQLSPPVRAHRSSLESAPVEHRRAAPLVSSVPDHLARRLRPSLPVPHRQTLPRLSGLAATGNHTTTGAPHAETATGVFVPHPHSQAGLGRVAAEPGHHSRAREAFRSLAMAGRNDQQAEALGQFQARYCVPHFQFPKFILV
jgi:hypothetical protein